MTTHSTILRWMISRTKKRLSKTSYYVVPVYIIALSALMIICAFVLQSMRPSPSYGVVRSQLPVLYERLDDPFDEVVDEFEHTINEKSPVVVLRLDAFIFGELRSFTKDFYRTDNKFRVAHEDGAPHIGKLLEQFRKWQVSRHKGDGAIESQPLLLYPVSEMPMPIVTQVMLALQKNKEFSHVILATDLL